MIALTAVRSLKPKAILVNNREFLSLDRSSIVPEARMSIGGVFHLLTASIEDCSPAGDKSIHARTGAWVIEAFRIIVKR